MFFTTRAFWTDFAERVVSTGAAGALTIVTLAGFGIFQLTSWHAVADAAGVAALISALKAFSLQRTGTTTTSTSVDAAAAAVLAYKPDLLERIATLPAAPSTPTAGGPTVVSGSGVSTVYPPAGE